MLTAHLFIVYLLDIQTPHSLAHLFTQKYFVEDLKYITAFSFLQNLLVREMEIFRNSRDCVSSNGGFFIEKDENIYRTECSKLSLPKWIFKCGHLITHGTRAGAVPLKFSSI